MENTKKFSAPLIVSPLPYLFFHIRKREGGRTVDDPGICHGAIYYTAQEYA